MLFWGCEDKDRMTGFSRSNFSFIGLFSFKPTFRSLLNIFWFKRNKEANKLISCCWSFFKTSWRRSQATRRSSWWPRRWWLLISGWSSSAPMLDAHWGRTGQIQNWEDGQERCILNDNDECSSSAPRCTAGFPATAWCGWWPLQDRGNPSPYLGLARGISEDKYFHLNRLWLR